MDTQLYRAALSGDINILREKERTIGVGDQLTPDKNSVLHVASQSDKIQFVQEILSKHPSLLLKSNSRGETALQLAAREGHSSIVKALVDEAKKSSTLEFVENGVGSLSTLKVMLSMANVDGDTVLHEAARYNQVHVVKVLLEDPAVKVLFEDCADESLHTLNKAGESPLYLAACRGHALLVETICETRIPWAYGGPDGGTALRAAIINESGECVKQLLAWKKDLIKETDNHGWSAFHYATCYDHKGMILQVLLELDKSMVCRAEKNGNRTAFHLAAMQGSIAVMKKLIEFCPDCCYMTDKKSRNILHIAVEGHRKKMIKCIWDNCPLISNLLVQKDIDGNTPLHLLSISGCFSLAIIRHKMADKEALNKENRTPRDALRFDDIHTIDKIKVLDAFDGIGVNRNTRLLRAIWDDKGKDLQVREKENAKKVKKIAETHMIVAALIVTIAFTAGFTLTGGGFNPNQGREILGKKAAFKAFMITDATAFLLSISSLAMYFIAATLENYDQLARYYRAAALANIVAIGAIMLAFITGTYVILAHSLGLAIIVCVIGCCFFFVLLYFIDTFVVKFVDVVSWSAKQWARNYMSAKQLATTEVNWILERLGLIRKR